MTEEQYASEDGLADEVYDEMVSTLLEEDRKAKGKK